MKQLPYHTEQPTHQQMVQLRRSIDHVWPIDADEKDAILFAWQLLHEHRLVIRPAVLGPGWYCGRLQSVGFDGETIKYDPKTTATASTLELAIYYASLNVLEVDKDVIKASSLEDAMRQYQERVNGNG